jgi:Meiotically up-regulated gene 113
MRLGVVPGNDIVDPEAEDIARAMHGILGNATEYHEQLVTLEPWNDGNPLDALLQKHFKEAPKRLAGTFMQAMTTEIATAPDDPWSMHCGPDGGGMFLLEDISLETVITLFQSLNSGDTSWRDYPWTSWDLDRGANQRPELVDRCIEALRQEGRNEIEQCRERVDAVRQTLRTTQDSRLKHWLELFDDLAEQLNVTSDRLSTQVSTPSAGVVYLLKAGPYYKIGYSADGGKRLGQIKLQLPYDVEQIHQIVTDDPQGIETYWHRRFARKRTNGEWFQLTDEDVLSFKSRTSM